ncbi:hypothetical protein H1C71_001695 [Ictidomys tridecemlineatus]|nr:hypothetical protein H1C71_001695 [Ictidomys tridecemlineatus]KAG3265251.1 hypothetical protein H1C71_001695 [Ictidomys tridecemlineatus]
MRDGCQWVTVNESLLHSPSAIVPSSQEEALCLVSEGHSFSWRSSSFELINLTSEAVKSEQGTQVQRGLERKQAQRGDTHLKSLSRTSRQAQAALIRTWTLRTQP